MTAAAAPGTCFARVHHGPWHTSTCGKPVKGTLQNGRPACGIHLAAERKRRETDERYARERAAQVERLEAARYWAGEINRLRPFLDARVSGEDVVVNGEQLVALLRRVAIGDSAPPGPVWSHGSWDVT